MKKNSNKVKEVTNDNKEEKQRRCRLRINKKNRVTSADIHVMEKQRMQLEIHQLNAKVLVMESNNQTLRLQVSELIEKLSKANKELLVAEQHDFATQILKHSALVKEAETIHRQTVTELAKKYGTTADKFTYDTDTGEVLD